MAYENPDSSQPSPEVFVERGTTRPTRPFADFMDWFIK
jgi:hypothetical protein